MSRGNLGSHPSHSNSWSSLRRIGPYFFGCFVMVRLFDPMAGVDGYIGKTQPASV